MPERLTTEARERLCHDAGVLLARRMPEQTVDAPEACIAISPGHQLRVLCGPNGAFGLVPYGNDPDCTFLRFQWSPLGSDAV